MFVYVHVAFTHRFVVEKTVFGYIQIKVRVIPLKVRVTATLTLFENWQIIATLLPKTKSYTEIYILKIGLISAC